MSERFVVIMAGGRGERFWPRSRLRRPKHLLPIVGDKPMLTQTVERLKGVAPTERIFVITNRDQQATVEQLLPRLPPGNVVGEPVGRDTAAAVGLATILVKRRSPDSVFAILPADHVIHDAENFRAALNRAFIAAERSPALITIGIAPTEPATGYGYIHRAEKYDDVDGEAVFRVKRFVEKPDRATAEEYLRSGEYLWNAGMFVWRVATIENALRLYAPKLHRGLAELEAGLASGRALSTLLDTIYPGIEKISIDYAVMEKASNVATIQSTFDWDDIGAWPAVARHFPADAGGNVACGETILEACTGNIVMTEGGHLVAALGVDDLIIIHTSEATLVCRKDRAQEIKKIIHRITADPRLEKLA